jgi:hypothetical protein
MLQSAIDDQNAFVASVSTAFDDGDATLNDLISSLGGNPAGQTISGAAGVPTTGTIDLNIPGVPVVSDASGAAATQYPDINIPSTWAWAPSPAAPVIVPGGGAGFRAPQGENRNSRKYTNAQSGARSSTSQPMVYQPGCPQILPLVTTIPIPQVVTPAAPASSSPAAPAPVVAPPTQPPAPLPDCRTGNWCLDIMNGCVLSSQVSQQQLMLCSQAGYAGNRNLFPAVAAAGGAGGGAFFGTPDPNPAPYRGSGVSGFGDDASAQATNADIISNAFEYVISGLVTVAAMAILFKGKKKYS